MSRIEARGVCLCAVLALGAGCRGTAPEPPPPPTRADMAPPPPAQDLAMARPDLPEVRIEGGTFRIGTDADGGGETNEQPAHDVTLLAFYLDRNEVTVAAYRLCVQARCRTGPCCTEPMAPSDTHVEAALCNWGQAGQEQHPVTCVDFYQATQFCQWMGRRLPTESEWEAAARGRGGAEYPWGDGPPPSEVPLCWDKFDGTCPVGSSPPTLLGAFHDGGVAGLADNVAEWTSSPYCDYADALCMAAAPPDHGVVQRGGDWLSTDARALRAAARSLAAPWEWDDVLGFRCARTP